VHFLQIWIEPNRTARRPATKKALHAGEQTGKLRLIASPDGRNDSVLIHQDAYLRLHHGRRRPPEHALAAGRLAYVHVIRGAVTVNGVALKGGDALKLSDENAVTLAGAEDAEILVFDLPLRPQSGRPLAALKARGRPKTFRQFWYHEGRAGSVGTARRAFFTL
jgi:redox-sensitive bicupin YhaK (pirin superfamily)